MESPKRLTDFTRNISEKWAPQTSSSRLKSLSDHKRSYSTLVRSIKSTKITSGHDKAKLDRIRQGCIPTVTLRDETETMIESDLDESQDEQGLITISMHSSAKNMWLVKSVYEGRPPTVYFPYCPETTLNEHPRS